MEIPVIPFKVLALASFLPDGVHEAIGEPLRVCRGELSAALKTLAPVLHVPLPQTICPAGGVDMQFNAMKDFTADGLIRCNRYLSGLKEAGNFLAAAAEKGLSEEEIRSTLKSWPDLPKFNILIPPKNVTRKPKEDFSSKVDDILSMVAIPGDETVSSPDPPATASGIDHILGRCLSEIIDYKPFRQLEAAWRGLELLMKQGASNGEVKVDIFPCRPEALEEALPNLVAHQAQDPPSLILVDIPLDSSAICLNSLKRVAEFSETMLAPAIVWITARFLQIDSWKDLDKLPFLPHHLENASFAKWRRLGDSTAGRWLGVTANRLLARYPHGPDNQPRQVLFSERRALWIGPVWAVGSLICRNVAQTGWPTRFIGMVSGSLENLPLDMADPRHPLCTETALPENRIDQMVRAGIMPMVGVSGRDTAFLPSAVTAGKSTVDYQTLVGIVTRLILWCKDNFEEALNPPALQSQIREAFRLFWEHRGNPAPENLEISIGRPDTEGKVPVRIIVTPSRQILPSGEKVELTLLW